MTREQIERYVLGLMSDNEKIDFEEKINSDEALRKQYELASDEIIGIEAHYLKKNLKSLTASDDNDINPKSSFGKYIPWIILGIFLISFITWYVLRQTSSSPEPISVQYAEFKPDPGLPTPMGSTEKIEFLTGMVEFKSGNFEKAIEIWTGLSDNDPTNDTLSFYLGNAYHAINDHNKAVEYYNTVMQKQSSTYLNKAYYNLALINLDKGNRDKAVDYLQLSNMAKSKILLEQLEEN